MYAAHILACCRLLSAANQPIRFVSEDSLCRELPRDWMQSIFLSSDIYGISMTNKLTDSREVQ